MKHTPVLLKQVIEGLAVKPEHKYIDATYGLGGHSREIIKKGGIVLGIDWDENQVKSQKLKLKSNILKLVCGNYADIDKIAKENIFFPVDGILFDLGLSMWQIDMSKRGFSYQKQKEPLDMRISTDLKIKASDIINNYSKQDLYEIFTKNAEIFNIWPIINYIIKRRQIKKIDSVNDLLIIIKQAVKNNRTSKNIKGQIFQALRIEVNQEYQNIKIAIEKSISLLNPGGRLVIIGFHPSEDRLIKRQMKKYDLVNMTKKAFKTKTDFRFERSAKLRIYIKN